MRLQGLEPWTPWLRVRCSTNWAKSAYSYLWLGVFSSEAQKELYASIRNNARGVLFNFIIIFLVLSDIIVNLYILPFFFVKRHPRPPGGYIFQCCASFQCGSFFPTWPLCRKQRPPEAMMQANACIMASGSLSAQKKGVWKNESFFMRPFYYGENTVISFEKEYNTPYPIR